MITDPRVPLAHQQPRSTAYEQMLERVRYEGAYPTLERADEAVRLVLAGFGRQLTGGERDDLAARLPLEAARVMTAQIPETTTLTGWAFVKDLAARSGGSLATTRWDTGSVFAAVTALADPDLITRILHQLPTGWALLFGRAELAPPRRQRVPAGPAVRRPPA
ncbi:DUF2267 domain-containing protein [Streptomyces sp. NPDC096079]|uniref:DUF2267 domain-containing protein n=1 Tax=Streptomyces sp. NPDC096079 TaxID=3155820 RepID=UPI003322BD37